MEGNVEGSTSGPLVLWRLLPSWLRGLVRTMRLKQWTKNGFVFIPLLFDRQLTLAHIDAVARVVATFALFCVMSSAVYVLNDLVDVEKDRQHPKKKNRAIASGQLPILIAIGAAIILPVIALGGALTFSLPLALVLAAYYAKDIAYSFKLKNIVIIDVLTLASGFILRILAGAVVLTLTTPFSPWLYVCFGSLALFLAVGKRRQELVTLADNAKNVRTVSKDYNMALLDDMLRLVTQASVISYTLYTIEAPTKLGGPAMLLTVPFVVYGIFRYLYLIHVKGEGSAPDEVLFKDRALLLDVILFVFTVGVILYLGPLVVAHAG